MLSLLSIFCPVDPLDLLDPLWTSIPSSNRSIFSLCCVLDKSQSSSIQSLSSVTVTFQETLLDWREEQLSSDSTIVVQSDQPVAHSQGV